MTLQVQIADVPDRDTLVAEIWDDNDMLAEVRPGTNGRYIVELYPNPKQSRWMFDLHDLRQAFSEAEDRLG